MGSIVLPVSCAKTGSSGALKEHLMSIKDIAKLAGVSPATVSRVLNNPDHRCSSEEVRERIWRIAREQNYLPNAAARDLKRGSERSDALHRVDVLMTRSGADHANPFYNELLRYVESEVHQHQAVLQNVWYDQRFADSRQCGKRMADKMVQQLLDPGSRSARPSRSSLGASASTAPVTAPTGPGASAPATPASVRDGLVVVGRCTREALLSFSGRYRAVVSISRSSGDFWVDEVVTDGARLAGTAIDYLVSLGHRCIGYAGNVHDEPWYLGYQQALSRHGIEMDLENVFPCELSEASGFEVMNGLMRRPDAPSAIFCANDMLALGMLRCMTSRGSHYYRPSIIGCDDIEEGQFCRPMLTSLSVAKRDMARFGVRLLFDRLEGGHADPVKVELEGKLMVRESCWRHTAADDIEYII